MEFIILYVILSVLGLGGLGAGGVYTYAIHGQEINRVIKRTTTLLSSRRNRLEAKKPIMTQKELRPKLLDDWDTDFKHALGIFHWEVGEAKPMWDRGMSRITIYTCHCGEKFEERTSSFDSYSSRSDDGWKIRQHITVGNAKKPAIEAPKITQSFGELPTMEQFDRAVDQHKAEVLKKSKPSGQRSWASLMEEAKQPRKADVFYSSSGEVYIEDE